MKTKWIKDLSSGYKNEYFSEDKRFEIVTYRYYDTIKADGYFLIDNLMKKKIKFRNGTATEVKKYVDDIYLKQYEETVEKERTLKYSKINDMKDGTPFKDSHFLMNDSHKILDFKAGNPVIWTNPELTPKYVIASWECPGFHVGSDNRRLHYEYYKVPVYFIKEKWCSSHSYGVLINDETNSPYTAVEFYRKFIVRDSISGEYDIFPHSIDKHSFSPRKDQYFPDSRPYPDFQLRPNHPNGY